MGFATLFAGLRKPKTNTTKQIPAVRDLVISSPLPLEVPQDRICPTVGLSTQGRLKRAPHVRRQNKLPQDAHLVQQHSRISNADLRSEGDLGLQGGPHRAEVLYSAHEHYQADSGYSTSKRQGPTYVPIGGMRQDTGSGSIGKTPLSRKAKDDDFEGIICVSQDSRESQVSDIFGFVAHRPRIQRRQPVRRASLVPSESSMEIFRQDSSATLCGSNTSNGKYEIEDSNFKSSFTYIKDIGEGGFGKIELHKHKKTARLLVLKITRSAVQHIDNIPAEVHIVRDILGNVHDRLPKLYHFNHSFAEINYWMEYCNGGDLVSFYEFHESHSAWGIPEGFIWHALTQLASALAFIHTGIDRSDPDKPRPANWQPVIHRDIKPENVFLKLLPPSSPNKHKSKTKNGKSATITTSQLIRYPDLVLGDFGLATLKMTSGEPNLYIGTPAYQPPQLPIHTLWSDIWALGAVTHYLALGYPPIAAQSAFSSISLEDFECIPEAREVSDIVKEGGYSVQLRETMEQWLCWEEERRPVGLKGALRAEGGRLLWLADGGVEEGVEAWETWARRGGVGKAVRTGGGARGFD
ncbi:MAG: hypothetical protein Q9166_005797 [cf. Caloplaca sp. 2 TL-2023]